MLIQLVYWKSVCIHSKSLRKGSRSHQTPSAQEREAFSRLLAKRSGHRFIRYR